MKHLSNAILKIVVSLVVLLSILIISTDVLTKLWDNVPGVFMAALFVVMVAVYWMIIWKPTLGRMPATNQYMLTRIAAVLFLVLPIVFSISLQSVVVSRWRLVDQPFKSVPLITGKNNVHMQSFDYPFQYYFADDCLPKDSGPGAELAMCRYVHWPSFALDVMSWAIVAYLLAALVYTFIYKRKGESGMEGSS